MIQRQRVCRDAMEKSGSMLTEIELCAFRGISKPFHRAARSQSIEMLLAGVNIYTDVCGEVTAVEFDACTTQHLHMHPAVAIDLAGGPKAFIQEIDQRFPGTHVFVVPHALEGPFLQCGGCNVVTAVSLLDWAAWELAALRHVVRKNVIFQRKHSTADLRDVLPLSNFVPVPFLGEYASKPAANICARWGTKSWKGEEETLPCLVCTTVGEARSFAHHSSTLHGRVLLSFLVDGDRSNFGTLPVLYEPFDPSIRFSLAFFSSDIQRLQEVDLSGVMALETIKPRAFMKSETLRYVRIVGLRELKVVESSFLQECKALQKLDLSDLPSLERIGDNFVRGCGSLHSLDLQGLNRVKVIEPYFAWDCTALSYVSLQDQTNLQRIGEGFLGGCKSLSILDLRGLISLREVSKSFVTYLSSLSCLLTTSFDALPTAFAFGCCCPKLPSFNCTCFPRAESTGAWFMGCCRSLATADLSVMQRLQVVGDNFFADCASLVLLVLPTGCIQTVGDNFLGGCSALEEVNLMEALQDVKAIGYKFCHGCNKLPSFGTEPQGEDVCVPSFDRLRTVGGGFLSNCGALSNVTLAQMSAVVSLDDCFLGLCTALCRVDFQGLASVRSIRNGFLVGCANLKSLSFKGLEGVITVGDGFLSDCVSLQEINFCGMESLRFIGARFLQRCSALKQLQFDGLQSVVSIGPSFLNGCASLEKIDFGGLKALSSIGLGFMVGVESLRSGSLVGLPRDRASLISREILLAPWWRKVVWSGLC